MLKKSQNRFYDQNAFFSFDKAKFMFIFDQKSNMVV